MTALVYTAAELLRQHDYARPQVEAGYRLHGGFLADGRYVSPRTLVRWPAVRAWQQALEARGFPLIDATSRARSRVVASMSGKPRASSACCQEIGRAHV